MPKPRLELPNIPASTVMELRSETALEAWHGNSEMVPAHSRIHEMARLLFRLHAEDDDELAAMDRGAQIAEALCFKASRDLGQPIPSKAQTDKVIRGLIDAVVDKDYANASIDRFLAAMEDRAFGTLQTYERIAIAYADGDKNTVEMAMRGAAVLHCALNNAAILADKDLHIEPLKLV